MRQTADLISQVFRDRAARVPRALVMNAVKQWFGRDPLFDPAAVVEAVAYELDESACVRRFGTTCPPLHFYATAAAADIYLATYARRARRGERNQAGTADDRLVVEVAASAQFLRTAGGATKAGRIMLGLVSGELLPAWLALHNADLPDCWTDHCDPQVARSAGVVAERLAQDSILLERLRAAEGILQ